MERRLCRSRKNRIVAGVAGGLGEYFDIDPVLVRVIFVVATLASGVGILAYIILWIVVPYERFEFQQNASTAEGDSNMGQNTEVYGYHNRKQRGSVVGGLVLVVLGVLFLAQNYIPDFHFSDTWPLILVAIGAGLIISSLRREDGSPRREEGKGEGHEGQ